LADRPRLAVFDLGGVLVRIARSWPEAAALAGFSSVPGAGAAGFESANHQLILDFQLGLLGEAAYFGAVCQASGGACSEEDARSVIDAWTQAEYAGIGAVFDALDEAGVPAALLSNTNPVHWRRLAALDGGNPEYPTLLRARYLFASHLMGCMKPDLAIFRQVEEATGIGGSDVLFFDDVAENVEGARAAGWRAEHIDHGNDTPAQLLRHLRRFGICAGRR
jgi:FMN phosphatase YigB (HAD superfamily)